MGRYYESVNGLYIDGFNRKQGGEFIEGRKHSYIGSLHYAREVKNELELFGHVGVEIEKEQLTRKTRGISIEAFRENYELREGTYYILRGGNNGRVYHINDYGEILISNQRERKLRTLQEIERYIQGLELYGIQGYGLVEVVENIEYINVE